MRSRVLVTVSEGARRAGVPRTTVSAWIRDEKLFAVGLDADGNKVYDLEAVRALKATTRRRRRRQSASLD